MATTFTEDLSLGRRAGVPVANPQVVEGRYHGDMFRPPSWLRACPSPLPVPVLTLLLTPAPSPMQPPDYQVLPVDGAAHDRLLRAEAAPWSHARLIRWGPAPYVTAFRALWNDRGLYVRFDADDDHPWHTMTRRDDALWEEEVVEIFIDADRSGENYAELEINPANVVCDLRIVRGKPDFRNEIAWDFAGLATAVVPLANRAGETVGWTAVAFMPWSDFARLYASPRLVLPPAGDRWRFNVFRIKRPGGPSRPAEGSIEVAWSPTGQASFHVPAAFRDLVFVSRP
jgi:hypothetical protein